MRGRVGPRDSDTTTCRCFDLYDDTRLKQQKEGRRRNWYLSTSRAMTRISITAPVSVKTAIVRMFGPVEERNGKVNNLKEQ